MFISRSQYGSENSTDSPVLLLQLIFPEKYAIATIPFFLFFSFLSSQCLFHYLFVFAAESSFGTETPVSKKGF